MENKNEQELAFKFQMFEQQIMAIQQQLQAIEQALVDMIGLSLGLDEIKKDKEVFASIGKGIFTRAKLISEDLLVDIGEKNYVKKSIKDTKELIQEQTEKLERVKYEPNKEMDKINYELTNVMVEYEKGKREK